MGLDINEMRRQHDALMKSFDELDRLQKSNAERAVRLSTPSPRRSLGLFGSLVVMACTIFMMLALIVLAAAIFL
ncbi:MULTISPECIES: hypothetical protein [Moraxella]|uniref:Uncharacterized protein n=1 Tax=Moraxella catarrhalis TaxID=480 RepID=A0A7Z0UXR1_MORCA|nr:hypothetical protein [Moraxella catarrhalis]OAV00232.1 hypothetical protein AO382_1382 [Moraxella catarrhalis]STY82500.1 Uncharacterised protein [Moraxella catarrhalis]